VVESGPKGKYTWGNMRNISVKVGLLYLVLTLVNIGFFTIIILENQIDLVTQNAKNKTELVVTNLYYRFTPVQAELNANPQEYSTQDAIVKELKTKIDSLNLVKNYILFKENRIPLYQSGTGFTMDQVSENDISNALNARDMMEQFYYPNMPPNSYKIHFFIPLSLTNLPNAFFAFELEMQDLDREIQSIYRFIGIFILFITVFHLLFGFFLNHILIGPIKELSRKSIQISEGELGARVKVRRKDEIGRLGDAFNGMAQSVQQTIEQLNQQNGMMKLELKMAGEVQKRIYPVIRKTDTLDIAIYHKPLIEVSGDYHDIFPLGGNRYGFLIADVSGHGVGAALITLLIKNLFQRYAARYIDSKLLIKQINLELKDLMTDYNRFFTAFYLIIDETNSLIFTNAGHQKGYLLRPHESRLYDLDTSGFLIGVMEDKNNVFQSGKTGMQTGDKVILFTDGIIEAKNREGKRYDMDNFLTSVKRNGNLPCEQMLDKMLVDFRAFTREEKSFDDETLMIIELGAGNREGKTGESDS
jgi:phosphoserine phosphatase RsbU/P